MYKIINKEMLAPNIYSLDILAPRVASSAEPGQFVIVIIDEEGERIPLTICDSDKEIGSVNIVVQAMGSSTRKMVNYKVGDHFKDFVGPLGQPSAYVNEEIEELKKRDILFIAGGVGTAPVFPQVKWLYDRGIDVDVIIGAKNEEMVILEDKIAAVANNVYITTDDGSYGFNGMVTDKLKYLVETMGKSYDLVVAIGPMIMMKFVCLQTKEYGFPTVVSMNPIMVDGTGMCGACRVSIGNETKFACVDGPEFDGHLVDFDEALKRQSQYKDAEIEANKTCCCNDSREV